MSGSEDGQLQSPGYDNYALSGEEDADSLDIKPPQANVLHARGSAESRRKDKTAKEKKHSKEKKHRSERERASDRERAERERNLRDRETREPHGRDMRNDRGGGTRLGADIERNRDHRRGGEEREEMVRYHQRGSGYERDDGAPRDMMTNSERRYAKHYDPHNNEVRRNSGGSGGGYHQQYQHPHIARQRQDYYERNSGGSGYHHGGVDYYNNRHQQQQPQQYGGGGKHAHMEYSEVSFEMQRERRKYNYDTQNDSESIEQDLRSRLLSKRHKFVKGSGGDVIELTENYESTSTLQRQRYSDGERNERYRQKREKVRESVIEVLDSPEVVELEGAGTEEEEARRQRRKHKRRNKEREMVQLEAVVTTEQVERSEKRKTPDDPEVLSRREKILAVEREKEKRKEMAREELEARRRARNALSPSAVAASVTAGLNVMKRKKTENVIEHEIKSKRSKKTVASKERSDEEEEGEAIDTDEEEEENESEDMETQSGSGDSESDSDSHSEEEGVIGRHEKHHRKRSKIEKKRKKKHRGHKSVDNGTNDEVDDEAEDLDLPESPLSIGELSKSPRRQHRAKKHKKKKSKKRIEANDDDEDGEQRSSRSRSRSVHSCSRSRSASRSRSRSHTPRHKSSHSRSRSLSGSSRRHTTRSRSRSRSNSHFDSRSESSRSHSGSSGSLSRSKSRTRSRSRSEERDMSSAHKTEEEATAGGTKRRVEGRDDSPARDDKGAPLPDYYPGIQGCRSVEEFQCLNRIEEGTYGVVYRAKDKRTNEIVALKRLKMEKEKEGFPITSLREINTLLKGQHPNIVTVREIVVGSNMDKIFIVMDYVEHDLKSLMETMKARKQFFLPGEVKCLTQQLLRAVGHLHDNWILHRDLKTSNLLLSHKGILKVGDFGLAREYGSPLKKYTSLVVTLWYRAPELLLCSPEYSTPIDIWSVGCIFGEFLQMAPLFPGKTETDELNKIFKELGTPNERIWPGYKDLPLVRNMLSQNSQFADYPVSNLRRRFAEKTTDIGIELIQGLLTYDPKKRLTAEAALKHGYFNELPLPIDPSMFPTWPAKSELGARKALASSPKPPSGGSQFKQLGRDEIIVGGNGGGSSTATGVAAGNSKVISGIITGNKKTATNTGFVLNAGTEQRQLAMGPGFNLKF
ncbi:serine/threonine-protein kinase PITSLRE [Anastrepha ludens]|uniref:serine/threonine-protein kinase PITSLRE n=1 Tax=Anastrepha ludens TaxID=28586 RepID=UPI0023AFF54A|nr:serine/threonine-protein kinase PITSLRE [Anastrepha ludens]